MVDVARLEERAARLRDQSAKLHKADADAGAATYRKVGQQKDEATQHLRAAQEAVKAAEAQAAEQHARAQDFEAQARDLEAGAKDEFNQAARISENDLEQAQKLRALAAAASERAAENHRAVARHQQDVQQLEQQIAGLQAQVDIGGSPTEKLADQLDDMVDRLSAAAANLRQADQLDAAGNPEAGEALREQAMRELRHLEQIRPDYRSVDPSVLEVAGITAADRDLLDPGVLPDDAPSTLPELIDPDDPTSDAGDVLGTDALPVAAADASDETLAEPGAPSEPETTDDPWAVTADADPAFAPAPATDVTQETPVVASFDEPESTGFEAATDDAWGADQMADDVFDAGLSDG